MSHLLRSIGLPILLGMIFFGGYVAFHLGIWRPVEVSIEDRASSVVVWREHLGAYHNIDPVLSKVEGWAHAKGLKCLTTFAQFLDDPDTTAEVDLRSRVGCLWGRSDEELLRVREEWIADGLHKEELSSGSFLVARFKGAPSIAPLKIYPRIKETLESNRLKPKGPMIHVYRFTTDGKFETEYLQQVDLPPQ